MIILFTADLHMNIGARSPRTGRTAFDAFAESVGREDPGAVVIAGDIGVPGFAARYLASIRKVVGERALAVALGNHDFWLDQSQHAQFACLGDVVDRYWREPCRDVGAALLDIENFETGDVAIAGGYGHYDLGLAEPDLYVRGVPVTEKNYLSGGMSGLFWNDFARIPNCGTQLRAEAAAQAEGLAFRMDEAIASGKRLLLAVHTCPWRELNGHPLRRDATDMLSAYSGNSLIGDEIRKRAASVEFLMCGHTHKPVAEGRVHGVRCLNVGADYGRFRGVVYDTDTAGIRWVGEPADDAT